MKKIVLAAVASLSFATPAFAADFTGPRIGATVGIAGDDVFDTDGQTFGLEAGFDVALGTTGIAGVQVEYQDDFDNDLGHELAATARVGGKVGESAIVYITGGYSRFDIRAFNLDGVRGGIGTEVAIGTSGAHLKVE